MTVVQRQQCIGCGSEIDPEVCHCGTTESEHIYEGHIFIPMGCRCGASPEYRGAERSVIRTEGIPPEEARTAWVLANEDGWDDVPSYVVIFPYGAMAKCGSRKLAFETASAAARDFPGQKVEVLKRCAVVTKKPSAD